MVLRPGVEHPVVVLSIPRAKLQPERDRPRGERISLDRRNRDAAPASKKAPVLLSGKWIQRRRWLRTQQASPLSTTLRN